MDAFPESGVTVLRGERAPAVLAAMLPGQGIDDDIINAEAFVPATLTARASIPPEFEG